MRHLKPKEEDLTPLLIKEENMSKDSTDPFYTVKDNVNSQVEKIKIKNEKFLDFVKNNDTSSNAEFKELRKGLVADLRKADKDLKGLLQGAIDMVEKNRLKFPHIKDAELAQRRRIVDEMQTVINDVKAGMESLPVRRKIENDENRAAARSKGSGGNGMSSNDYTREIEKDNSRFIASQSQITKDAITHQDVQLDDLGNAVDRLGFKAKDIKQELNEQNLMLDELDNEMEDAGNKMNVVTAALSKLLKTKDGCQVWTIVILAVILVILVALVIWV